MGSWRSRYSLADSHPDVSILLYYSALLWHRHIHYSACQLFKAESQGKTVFLKRKTGYLNISHIAETLLALGINLTSLPLMNALSGCDTTSYFYGSGKTTAGATNEEQGCNKTGNSGNLVPWRLDIWQEVLKFCKTNQWFHWLRLKPLPNTKPRN